MTQEYFEKHLEEKLKPINDLQDNMKSITHQMMTFMNIIQEMNSNMLTNRNLELNDDFQDTKSEDSNKISKFLTKMKPFKIPLDLGKIKLY